MLRKHIHFKGSKQNNLRLTQKYAGTLCAAHSLQFYSLSENCAFLGTQKRKLFTTMPRHQLNNDFMYSRKSRKFHGADRPPYLLKLNKNLHFQLGAFSRHIPCNALPLFNAVQLRGVVTQLPKEQKNSTWKQILLDTFPFSKRRGKIFSGRPLKR